MGRNVKIGLVVLAMLGSLGVCLGAYTRDVTGDLRKDAATGIQACLVALEALIAQSEEPAAVTYTLVTKATTTAGTGVKLVAAETFARKVVLMAKRADAANTGIVYIGTSTVDKTTPQQIALAPGDSITIDPGPGCKVDLATIYIDSATSTDGVTGYYFPE